MADHGGAGGGRHRNGRNRGGRRGGRSRTVIRAKPRPSQGFQNFPTKAQPNFADLGPPPQPAGFSPPRGIPAARALPAPVNAIPVRQSPRRNNRPAPQKAVRAGRQFSSSDPDVRGNRPDADGNYDFQ